MKKALYYSVVSILTLVVFSCGKSDDTPQYLETTVKGKAIDQVRNTVYSNDTIILSANYSCGSGFNSGVCYEFVASTVTDSNGEYEFTFDYNTDKGYTVGRSSKYEYYDTAENLPVIRAGEMNTINFEGWRPVIFKVEASVSNNIFKNLNIQTRDDQDNSGFYTFPSFIIKEENINTTLYLHGKPKTQMSIVFSYSDDDPQSNYHELRKTVNTIVQDTIPLSYEVNCNSF